jgi:hypothetical protein
MERLRCDALSHHRSRPEPTPRLPQRVERRLNAEMPERIMDEYVDGTSTTRLAACYGVGKGALLRLLRENGVIVRRHGGRRHLG